MSPVKKTFGIIITLLLSFQLFAQESVVLKRYALVIGSNDGGTERIQLQYAAKDANSFAGVMKQWGALDNENLVLLINPDAGQVDQAFEQLKSHVAAEASPNIRKEFVLYYSGHSNESGLLLFEENYPYKSLRDSISSMNVDVRVAILDSCASGAFTRTKGGVRKSPFIIDSSVKMEGYAFLTSSAEDEVAQESDSIGGSFFTHYLISGLRGAADTTQDKIVTLNEAYSYAFRETLNRTENTQYGAQHPKYDIQLKGTGDLVLTDLRALAAGIVMEKKSEGTYYFRDSNDNLVAEVNKLKGQVTELGLEPGTYTILTEKEGSLIHGKVELRQNQKISINEIPFSSQSREATVTRGDGSKDLHVPVAVTFFPDFSEKNDGFAAYQSYRNFAFNFLVGKSLDIFGGELSILGSSVSRNMTGLQIASIGHFVGGDMKGLQIASIFNRVEKQSIGMQLSGIYNTSGTTTGFQLSSIFNASSGLTGFQLSGAVNVSNNLVKGCQLAGLVNLGADIYGLQLGGLFNRSTGSVTGFQLAGLVNLADWNFTGLQLGGLFNRSTGSVTGFQLAGLINLTDRNFTGLQLGGLVNMAKEDVMGFQLSGLNNNSGNIYGVQLAGIANSALTLKGLQIGLFNLAKEVSGVQIGLINISGEYKSGLPLGLINLSTNGKKHIDLWSELDNNYNLSLRLKTGFLYTLINLGYSFSTETFTYGAGYGLGLDMNNFFLNLDAALNVKNVRDNFFTLRNDKLQPVVRLWGGMKLAEHFSVYCGIAGRIHTSGLYNDPLLYTNDTEILSEEGENWQIIPLLFAGIAF